jgi:hypothetical protein
MLKVHDLVVKYGFLCWSERGNLEPHSLRLAIFLREVGGAPIDTWGKILREMLQCLESTG